MKKFLIIIALAISPILKAQTIESYKYSTDVETSQKYAVTAANQPVTVLRTPEPDIAIFGCDAKTELKITLLKGSIDSLIVRPIAKNYDYSFEGNVITLKLKPGDRVSVEPNHSTDKPLFIFVNPLEAEAVKAAKADPNTVFYAEGEVYDIGRIPMGGGKNLYIQGGAYVNGYVDVRDSHKGYRLEGCGILDGSFADGDTWPKKNAVRIENCPCLTMSGLTVLNKDYWTVYFVNCDNSRAEDVKVVATFSHKADGTGNENDGFDVCSCQHFLVKGCFAYVHDDAFCIKSSTPTCTRLAADIRFEDCVAWNYESGNSFEIGYRLAGGVENVHYQDIYAIHSGRRGTSRFRRSGLSVHMGSPGYIKDIHYDNVWIEDPLEHSFNINVFKTPYKTYEWNPGRIDGIYINNLHVLRKAPLGGVVKGYDAEHLTTKVVFTNYFLEGKKVTTFDDADIQQSEFSKDIEIR